ncbi:hypothetical protein M0804_005983 [Polistes exclamans]|nr:hypothetical protein M0804_005983 [Polistes exclamans]
MEHTPFEDPLGPLEIIINVVGYLRGRATSGVSNGIGIGGGGGAVAADSSGENRRRGLGLLEKCSQEKSRLQIRFCARTISYPCNRKKIEVEEEEEEEKVKPLQGFEVT